MGVVGRSRALPRARRPARRPVLGRVRTGRRGRSGSVPLQRCPDLRGAGSVPHTGRPPMRLGTIRTASGTSAVRIDGDLAIEIGASDVGALLAAADWRAQAGAAGGPPHPGPGLSYAPRLAPPGENNRLRRHQRPPTTATGAGAP